MLITRTLLIHLPPLKDDERLRRPKTMTIIENIQKFYEMILGNRRIKFKVIAEVANMSKEFVWLKNWAFVSCPRVRCHTCSLWTKIPYSHFGDQLGQNVWITVRIAWPNIVFTLTTHCIYQIVPWRNFSCFRSSKFGLEVDIFIKRWYCCICSHFFLWDKRDMIYY